MTTVLITGDTGLIGDSLCTRYLEFGSDVIGISSSQEKIKHPNYRHLKVSLNTPYVEFLNKVVDYKTIDIIINCAGKTKVSRIEDTTTDDFVEIFEINLLVPFILSREFFRHNLTTTSKKFIINVASMAHRLALRHQTAYCASKAALVAMTKQMAREIVDVNKNFHIYAVSPCNVCHSPEKIGGMIDNTIIPGMLDIGRFSDETLARAYNNQSPTGHGVLAEDVARFIWFLTEYGPINQTGTNFEYQDGGM